MRRAISYRALQSYDHGQEYGLGRGEDKTARITSCVTSCVLRSAGGHSLARLTVMRGRARPLYDCISTLMAGRIS
jgi:hypothetical protein